MKQTNKDNIRRNHQKDSVIPLSVIVPDYTDNKKLSLFLDSIKNIINPIKKDYEIVIPATSAKSVINYIKSDEDIGHLVDMQVIKVIQVPDQMTQAQRIREGLQHAVKKNLVIFEISLLEKAFNFDLIFQIDQDTIDKNKFLVPRFIEDTDKKKNIHWPVLVLSAELANYLFSDIMASSQDYQIELFKKARKLNFSSEEVSITHHSPFSSFQKQTTGFFAKRKWGVQFFICWYIGLPIKELKSKPHLGYPFLSGPSYLRLVFVSIAFALFLIIPIMSYDSGISGDEQRFHYLHGQNVYNYFATGGKDTSAIYYNNSVLHLYGPAFDLVTVIFIKIFQVENEYEFRHILNGWAGWLAILFAGLLAILLAGWRAGVITLVLLFLSPRFLGHSFNNPKDIPFAMAFVFTLYYIIKFLKEFPRPSISTTLLTAFGIGLAIGVRIGGLLLVAYLFLFSGIYFLVTSRRGSFFAKTNMKRSGRLFVFLAIISILGYFIGIATWPYALQAPLSNPIKALGIMTDYTTSLRQLFEGEIIWSNRAPWYYVPKYIVITVPIVVLTGLVLFFATIHKLKKNLNYLWLFIIAFSFIFPVIYIINKESNVYGGWRHTMFVYPSMVIAASIGLVTLYNQLKPKILKYISAGLFLLLCLLPFRHIVVNHPHQYIYYNELTGGTNGALGEYEMDYYFHSLKAGSEWLIENKIKPLQNQSSKPILVASNSNIDYYFRNYKDQVQTVYIRYYERSTVDWDYAIFANSFINPYQLKNGLWPSENTIHTIDVDKIPICAIMERKNKLALEGNNLINEQKLLEGINMLEQAVALEPANEHTLLVLAKAYIDTQQYVKAVNVLNQCLEVYPDYDRALNLLGIMYMDLEMYAEAIDVFIWITKINERFVSAYHNLGLVYINLYDIDMALRWFLEATEVNKNYKPSYMAIAEIYNQLGMYEEAQYYFDIGNQLK